MDQLALGIGEGALDTGPTCLRHLYDGREVPVGALGDMGRVWCFIPIPYPAGEDSQVSPPGDRNTVTYISLRSST